MDDLIRLGAAELGRRLDDMRGRVGDDVLEHGGRDPGRGQGVFRRAG